MQEEKQLNMPELASRSGRPMGVTPGSSQTSNRSPRSSPSRVPADRIWAPMTVGLSQIPSMLGYMGCCINRT